MSSRVSQEIRKTKVRFSVAGLLLLAAAIGLSVIWNRSIKEELATQATSFVRKGMISTDMRGVRESLSGIQLSSFEDVTLYDPTGERMVTFPPIFDYRAQEKSFWRFFLFDTIRTEIYMDREQKESLGTLVFSYSRFGLAKEAIIVWILAAIGLWFLLSPAIKKVQQEIQSEIRMRNVEALEEVAKKVRHNIRSPLSVLKALFLDRALNADDFFEQGQGAVLRLEEIVAEIKTDFQKSPKEKSARAPLFEVSKVAERIVSEKQVIAGEVDIVFTSNVEDGAVYCELPASELRATLSNLIDNSLQAIEGPGRIQVRLECDDHSVAIEIVDSGRGVPEDLVPHVFEKGFTHGKKDGTGLGLHFAKKLVESYQGNIDLRSQVNIGTTIAMMLPRKSTPSWHVNQLDLSLADDVIVCDDVPGILKAWQMRFKTLGKAPRAQFFGSCEEIIQMPGDAHLYLIDYDLGEGRETGLDFARRLKDPRQFVLVTGNFDAPEIQDACTEAGCKLLPKDEIAQVRIV